MNRIFAPVCAGLMTLATLGAALPAAAQDEPKNYSGADVYRLFCVICHGPKGQGSPLGKSLISPEAMAKSDDEIAAIISQGKPDKGMMSFGGSLSVDEIRRTMELVRELQGKAAARSSKQAAAAPTEQAGAKLGEMLFRGKAGCIQCHSFYTEGGLMGPILDKVGVRLTPEQLKEAVEAPSKTIADGFGAKDATLPDGSSRRARFRNESPGTLQLLNDRGDLWTTYIKKELKGLADAPASIMPESFAKLAPEEQAALIEFLQTLK